VNRDNFKALMARVLVLGGGGLAITFALPWWVAFFYWIALVGLFAWEIARNPFIACWLCNGSGLRSGKLMLSPWGRGPCWRCRGKKGFIRMSVRILTPRRARRLAETYNMSGYEESSRTLIP
jgi:hypothetical protein